MNKNLKGHLSFCLVLVVFILLPCFLMASEKGSDTLNHPMMKPKMYSKNMKCPNCGMMINMWARTRHTFNNSEGSHETCSIRCMSDMSNKIGEQPTNSRVALYTAPDTMIDAEKAFYVVGSKAKGTMTMKSKLAFASQEAAKAFITKNGGKITPFQDTFKMAAMEVNKTREKIQGNRIKKGKIVQPTADDSCTVCGMKPANYPNNHTQVRTENNDHFHFCSTKCLVNYLDNPQKHVPTASKTKEVYVTVQGDGDYEYAKGLYYVVGSNKMGPMGPEAFAFRSKAKAQSFVDNEGGEIVRFERLSPSLMGGGGKHMKMGKMKRTH